MHVTKPEPEPCPNDRRDNQYRRADDGAKPSGDVEEACGAREAARRNGSREHGGVLAKSEGVQREKARREEDGGRHEDRYAK